MTWYMFPKYGPVELCCKIIEMVDDWPVGLEEAEKIRMGFLQKREGFRMAIAEYGAWDFGDYEWVNLKLYLGYVAVD